MFSCYFLFYSQCETFSLAFQYSHPALVPNYKGYNNATGSFNHNYNWWDGVKSNALPGAGTCGINSQVPCGRNRYSFPT